MKFTADDVDRATRGGGRLDLFGKCFVRRLSTRDLRRFDEAKKRGYLVVRACDEPALVNAWRAWTSVTNEAYVVVHERKQHARVVIDLASARGRIDASAVLAVRALFAEVGGDEDDDWVVCAARAEHLRVPLGAARAVASAVSEIAWTHREVTRARHRDRRERCSLH